MILNLSIAVPIKDLINSNSREHRHVVAQKRSLLRRFAREATAGLPAVATPARGVVVFVWPDKARRDPDNYELKWLWDGIVDSGILPDDNGNQLRATVRFAAPWRHDLGRGIVVLGIKVEPISSDDWEAI